MSRLGRLVFVLSAVLSTVLFALSCQSSGPREPAHTAKTTRKTGAEKPTQVELASSVTCTGRRPDQVESAVLLNPAVLSCLRQELKTEPAEFSLEISGQLTAQGKVESFRAESSSSVLKACLEREFSRFNLGQGGAGPFKMHIERVAAGGTKAKTFLLDLSETKRLQ